MSGCGAVLVMEAGPSGTALQGEVSNHRKLLRLRAVVVSVAEKAHVMRQVGTGKANVSEPLLKCRKRSDGNRNRGPVVAPGRARGIPVYCPGGCPARRWRELGLGAGTKRGNPSP